MSSSRRAGLDARRPYFSTLARRQILQLLHSCKNACGASYLKLVIRPLFSDLRARLSSALRGRRRRHFFSCRCASKRSKCSPPNAQESDRKICVHLPRLCRSSVNAGLNVVGDRQDPGGAPSNSSRPRTARRPPEDKHLVRSPPYATLGKKAHEPRHRPATPRRRPHGALCAARPLFRGISSCQSPVLQRRAHPSNEMSLQVR